MIILVEGNEGTGKTTLINQIIKEMPMVYVKYPKEVKRTNHMYMDFIGMNQDIILDRSFISDMVYRSWDKNDTQMTLVEIANLFAQWYNSIKIIFCHNYKAFEKSMSRGEDYITDISTHEIIERNYQVIEDLIKAYTNCACFDYNYEENSVEEVLEFLRGENVDRRRQRR